MNYLKTFLPYLFGNKQGKSFLLPADLDWEKLTFEETLMFHTLRESIADYTKTLTIQDLTPKQAFHLFSFRNYLPEQFLGELKKHFHQEFTLFTEALKGEELSGREVQELLNYKTHQLSLFALFTKDRTRPGRLFIRKADGTFVHKKNGSPWSVKVLGTSGRGLPFNHSNGTTPCGVYSVDSVMPEANKPYEFGVFRRLIVNFLAATAQEENLKQFLPRSHRERLWWKPCLVGRELGRSLLRIHGTGRINKNPFTPYFPMIPSSGCLTTTERSFMGIVKINDQRLLLDALMLALNLPATFENESKIHGLLYVIEFDGTYQALEFKS